MGASLKCLSSAAERYASAARTIVRLIVGSTPDDRCVVLSLSCGARLRSGIRSAIALCDACCAAGVAIPPRGKEPRNFGSGRFHETTTRVRALEALAPGAGHRAAAGDEAPGPASMIGVPDVATWPRSQPASAVSLRIPRRHVPDADSDRARLPGTGPAPRPGASQDVPGEGLTQGTINAQTGQRW